MQKQETPILTESPKIQPSDHQYDLKHYQEEIRLRHDFCLILSDKINQQQVEALCQDFQQNGFRAIFHENNINANEKEYVFFLSLNSQSKLFEEAERLKVCRSQSSYSSKEKEDIQKQIELKFSQKDIDKRILFAESFQYIKREDQDLQKSQIEQEFQIYFLISEADRVRISYKILSQLTFSQMQKLNEQMPSEKFNRIDRQELFLNFLKRHIIYKDITALHSKSRAVIQMIDFVNSECKQNANLSLGIMKKASSTWFLSVDIIRDYYGDEIAIYFAWMNFFQRWIVVPAIFGFFIFSYNQIFHKTVEKSPLNALFSFLMSIWAPLFSMNWKRNQRSLKILWNNSSNQENHNQEIREQFRGTPKVNPVTEIIEPFYPSKDRNIKYIQSFFICLPIFAFVFVYLIAAYNITGVIKPGSQHHDFFVIKSLSDLAEKDAMFDADSNAAYITTIGQVICTMILNMCFRKIAIFCTDRENHKYKSSYENSLIVKRFMFEFFDCFLPLIYLGWWDLNFALLRQSIISVYIADELRRVACESLLPYLTQNQEKISKGIKEIAQKSLQIKNFQQLVQKMDAKMDQKKLEQIVKEELEELEKDEYEQFDDYMEMIVTFGYITMFASVFPFGATIILIFILIEQRSDLFKLETTMKRPIPEKTYHIGSWTIILEIFCLLAVFSNIIVSCFASDQVDYLLPWMKQYRDNADTSLSTVFILEHILLFSVFLIKMIYDDDPKWVKNFISRKTYFQDQKKIKKLQSIYQ